LFHGRETVRPTARGRGTTHPGLRARWYTEFWGADFNPSVIDDLAAPDIRFEYSLHAPCHGREEVQACATKFRAASPTSPSRLAPTDSENRV
jgi:hypothetical protein